MNMINFRNILIIQSKELYRHDTDTLLTSLTRPTHLLNSLASSIHFLFVPAFSGPGSANQGSADSPARIPQCQLQILTEKLMLLSYSYSMTQIHSNYGRVAA
jgi:hypothetical protein